MTHRQADQTSASDKKHAEGQETHFRRVDRLLLESDKQPRAESGGRFCHIFKMTNLAEVPGTV